MMYKVSVVIPLYNKAKYLDSMVRSLLSQTLSSVEFIFVDDGSTDGSGEIIKSYLGLDNRIKLCSQVNSGAGAARNRGIRIAEGEYITFFDADDLFDADMLKSMYDAASDCGADICVCSTRVLDDATGALSEGFTIPTPLFGLTRKSDRAKFNRYTSYNVVVWNKLFRREFIIQNQIGFQTCRSANDVYFAAACLYAADSIVSLPDRYVTYRKGIVGNLQCKDRDSANDIFVPIRALLERIGKEGAVRDMRELSDFAIGSIYQQLYTFGNIEAIEALYDAAFSNGEYSSTMSALKTNGSLMNKARILLCENVDCTQFRQALRYVYSSYEAHTRPTNVLLYKSYIRLVFAFCSNVLKCRRNEVRK